MDTRRISIFWKHWKIKGLFIFIFFGSFVPVLAAKFPKFSHVVGIITMTTIQPNLLSFIIVNVVMGVIAWIYAGDVQERKKKALCMTIFSNNKTNHCTNHTVVFTFVSFSFAISYL